MKNEYFGIFIMKFLILRVIEENAYQKKYSKELMKLGFSAVIVCILELCYEESKSS